MASVSHGTSRQENIRTQKTSCYQPPKPINIYKDHHHFPAIFLEEYSVFSRNTFQEHFHGIFIKIEYMFYDKMSQNSSS